MCADSPDTLERWPECGPAVLVIPATLATSEVLAAIRRNGADGILLDLSGARGKQDLMSAVSDALDLPGWFGRNWDALADALVGPEAQNSRPRALVLIGFDEFARHAAEEASMLIEIIRDVAETAHSGFSGAVLLGSD